MLKYQQNNPKKIGSQTHYRYKVYKKSKTVGDAKDKGSTAADFKEDRKKGFVQKLKKKKKKKWRILTTSMDVKIRFKGTSRRHFRYVQQKMEHHAQVQISSSKYKSVKYFGKN